ncbi:MAG: ribosomal protein S18-alanine N-acetyltransferase [Thermomicrobiales bacterium]|nr:ribosomal protein S18-alanine N-acetyltransferase [Thermomicrobiales bacterium]
MSSLQRTQPLPPGSASEPLYRLDLMTADDVPAVGRVERRCFPNPWPASAYRRELQDQRQNYYLVLRATPLVTAEAQDDAPGRGLPRRSLLPLHLGRRHDAAPISPQIIGFAGMWQSFDEAHVTTIGVDPAYRGQSLGELLLLCMFDAAIARGANWLTLEVRVSNEPALALYRKYGFTVHGVRKRYYSDNNEDAHIMWSRALSEPDVRAELEMLRAALQSRLQGRVDPRGVTPFPAPPSGLPQPETQP